MPNRLICAQGAIYHQHDHQKQNTHSSPGGSLIQQSYWHGVQSRHRRFPRCRSHLRDHTWIIIMIGGGLSSLASLGARIHTVRGYTLCVDVDTHGWLTPLAARRFVVNDVGGGTYCHVGVGGG